MKNLLIITVSLIIFSCSGAQKKEKDTGEKKISKQENAITQEPQKPAAHPKEEKADIPDMEMIFFEGGKFQMGSKNGLPNEQPVHDVTLKPFYIDKTPVTVAQFRAFVKATDFKTEAEKFGDSGVYNLEKQNWELLPGAFWLKPFGPSGPEAEDNHPVTHVSWNDALAYAKWTGKRLPSEAEWEYAARSGKNNGNKFSWGNKISVNGKYFANTWQGPINQPKAEDGYLFTSPVGAFGENQAGLTDMGGNVWQWCEDNYKSYPGNQEPVREDPNVKVIRSGSFFFDQNGEDSFSVSGRSMNSIETSLFNTGFRCAKDAKN